jgi:hypothetical protein
MGSVIVVPDVSRSPTDASRVVCARKQAEAKNRKEAVRALRRQTSHGVHRRHL